MANATSAASETVAQNAAVMAMDADGKMGTLREGTNNFTCMPDNATSPDDDPMCLDQNGMEWAHAWMTNTAPPAGKVGFGYMLQGGSDASNEDRHATGPAAGEEWVDTGPHMMLFNVGAMAQGYPSQKENPDTSQPYVIWPGTPHEHLMVPVQSTKQTEASRGAASPSRAVLAAVSSDEPDYCPATAVRSAARSSFSASAIRKASSRLCEALRRGSQCV
jgi:hypothetical protein